MAVLEHLHPMQFEKLTTPVEYHPASHGANSLRTHIAPRRTQLNPGRTMTYMTPAGISRRADVEHKTRHER